MTEMFQDEIARLKARPTTEEVEREVEAVVEGVLAAAIDFGKLIPNDDATMIEPATQKLESAKQELADVLLRRLAAQSDALPIAPKIDINAVIRDVAELPNRTSPEDQPDMMLVSGDELHSILSAHALNVAQSDGWRETMTLIRDRALNTSPGGWIEDAAAIHSLAYCALKESAPPSSSTEEKT